MKWANTANSFNPTTIVNPLRGINAPESSGNTVNFFKLNFMDKNVESVLILTSNSYKAGRKASEK